MHSERCATNEKLTNWSAPIWMFPVYYYRPLPYDPVRPWKDADGKVRGFSLSLFVFKYPIAQRESATAPAGDVRNHWLSMLLELRALSGSLRLPHLYGCAPWFTNRSILTRLWGEP